MSSVLLFAANDGGTGNEAWLTNADGTSATLIDLFPGTNGSFPFSFSASVDGKLFFPATDQNAGTELFVSDGTVAGTRLFADIRFGTGSSFPFQGTSTTFSVIGDTLYFSAFDSGTGAELYKTTSDGPPILVRDLNPGSSSSNPNFFVDLNGTLIFAASDGTSGNELYRSDGTEAGTQRIIDLNPGSGSSNPFMFQSNILNGELFFAADDGSSGDELWKTDGTAAGTTLVRDINPGSFDSFPSGMLELDGTLYFSADDGSAGVELWRTDGTEGGTSLVKDINSGSGDANIGVLAKLDDALLFFADDGSSGLELWRSDGTSAGTTLVRNINPNAFTGGFVNTANSKGEDIVIFNGKGYFIANDGSNGVELWQTDGTTGGTVLFSDINPGAGSSNPSELTVADGLMYFGANNGTQGQELWVTDGTQAGTRLVQDVRVGANSSFAQPVGVIDINVAPEQATLSNDAISENFAPGSTVGALAAVDADGDALTFTLTDDAGGRFAVNGDLLVTAHGLDFETAQSHSVTVQAADPSGATSSQSFTVNVTNIVEAPNAPTLSNAAVAENSNTGTTIGSLSAVNPEGGAVTFSLTDTANGLFTLNGNTLQTAGTLDFEESSTQSVTVRATGAGNTTADATFTINVTDINEAPGDITLSGDTVAENAAAGTAVGSVGASDPDGDTLTFSLGNNAGGAFSLNGTTLQTTAPLDFEQGATRSVTVDARDADGLTSSETFTINVTDVDEAPDPTVIDNRTVAENSATGTTVGTVSAAGAVSFALFDNAGGLFSLNGNLLQVAGNLDFEAAASQNVIVRATSADSSFTDSTLSIAVTDVNEVPGAVTLSANTVVENAAAGTAVGSVGASDPDGDTLTFSLGNNAGGAFSLNGTTLQTTAPLDFEQGATRSVTVDARDAGGLTSSETFTINVTDVDESPTTGVTLVGTPAGESLSGTDFSDSIEGRAGNDTLNGLGGNDTLNGEDGSDNISGGDGNDLLIGGTSTSDLRDNIFGGAGDDTIRGGHGNDEVRGDAGNDLVEGGFGADTVFGGTGNDSITGAGFGDLLFGAEGNDFINGGFGFDRVNGGAGADEFFHLGVEGHGTDFIQDYNAAQGDVLVTGIAGATADQFQINLANTPNAGDSGIAEAFIIYKPTGQIMWALIDGAGQEEINLQITGTIFDLTA